LAQIFTVTVPAYVISLNGYTYIESSNTETVVGQMLPVPCRDILYDVKDRWAVPCKDHGIFTRLDFKIKSGEDLAQPSYDSFSVFRIRDTKSSYEWMIYGTQQNLISSCQTCCDGTPVPMPMPAGGQLMFAPCQPVYLTNTLGQPYMVFGIPSLGAGQTYFPYGSFNNVAYPTASSAGYATISALLVFLNANFTPYTWTASGDGLTLFATGGAIGDVPCVSIIAVNPS
jgi:hypothetical protein